MEVLAEFREIDFSLISGGRFSVEVWVNIFSKHRSHQRPGFKIKMKLKLLLEEFITEEA